MLLLVARVRGALVPGLWWFMLVPADLVANERGDGAPVDDMLSHGHSGDDLTFWTLNRFHHFISLSTYRTLPSSPTPWASKPIAQPL
jgi:hypothetical protein